MSPTSAPLRGIQARGVEEAEILGPEPESHDLEKVRFRSGEAVKSEVWRPPTGGPSIERDARPGAQSTARTVSLVLSLKSH